MTLPTDRSTEGLLSGAAKRGDSKKLRVMLVHAEWSEISMNSFANIRFFEEVIQFSEL